MHPSRIFDKPTGVHDSLPLLQVVGVLPNYEEAAAYEGRLDILNAVGDCRVELLENNLPPGATAMVDNATQEVVIRWPPYTPPETEKPGIINWDFQLETLEGWNDLRGNSWRCENSIALGTNWATDGDYVGVMRGAGRGDHTLESIRYPATPGEPVTARALWDQGPSNKDNNNLWTAIIFYGAGGQSHEVRGDRIHDRTNKSRHHSTVNTTTPAWAEAKAVRLIAQRRNGRNRWIAVDSVQTSGFMYPTGNESPAEFYHLRLRVTDSANRVAYWSGIILSSEIRVLTTGPYPAVGISSAASGGGVVGLDGYDLLSTSPRSSAQSSGAVISMELWVSQAFHEYSDMEQFESDGVVAALSMQVTSNYYTQTVYSGADSSGAVLSLSMQVTTTYVNYAVPSNAVDTIGSVIGISMQ